MSQGSDVKTWVKDYVHARYGKDNDDAQKAWSILLETLYNCKDKRHGPQGSFLSMPASLNPSGGGFARADIFYDTSRIREAFQLLLTASNELGFQDTYCYDLVDLGRQVMSDFSQQKLHVELRAALAAKDAVRFDKASDAYYQAILDTDKLLRTHRLFQLGNYLRYPKMAVESASENARFEQNARRLITLWGGSNAGLFGYAQRQYGGLLADYNLNSWKLVFGTASKALHAGTKYDAGAADRAVRAYTEEWIHQNTVYPEQAEGDAVAVARMICDKYCKAAAGASLRDEVVGRWKYTAAGKDCVREFAADGSLRLYINGGVHAGWNGFTWHAKDGEIICQKADGTVFGKHKLQDPQTLLFIGEPFGPATRDIEHHE